MLLSRSAQTSLLRCGGKTCVTTAASERSRPTSKEVQSKKPLPQMNDSRVPVLDLTDAVIAWAASALALPTWATSGTSGRRRSECTRRPRRRRKPGWKLTRARSKLWKPRMIWWNWSRVKRKYKRFWTITSWSRRNPFHWSFIILPILNMAKALRINMT